MPDPFISRQDLTDVLGRDVTNDAGALIAVDTACDIVRDAMGGQDVQFETSTVVLDGTGTNALPVPQLPLVSAGTVALSTGTVTDYAVDTQRGLLLRRGTDSDWWWNDELPPTIWPEGTQNVTVAYEHGWADADIPRSIRGIALALASRYLVQGPAISEGVGGVTATYAAAATELTASERMILRQYHR